MSSIIYFIMMIYLDLCDINLYDSLAEYDSLDKKEELREITKTEGYDISLIIPSNVSYLSKEYLKIANKIMRRARYHIVR